MRASIAIAILVPLATLHAADAQSPSTAKPNPQTESAGLAAQDAFSRLTDSSRKIVNDRARDIYELPNGIFLDGYRINRLRDLVGKKDWSKIDPREASKLGLGHTKNQKDDPIARGRFGPSAPFESDEVSYKGLPDFYEVIAGDKSALKGWILFVAYPSINPTPALYNSNSTIVTHPMNTVNIVQVLGATEVLARVHYSKGGKPPGDIPADVIHISGQFDGAIDGADVSGDFFLQPDGIHTYTNTLGAKATVAGFRLVRLGTSLAPAALASVVEAGKLKLMRYSSSESGTGKAIAHTWKATPITLQFKPAPIEKKKPDAPG